MTAEQTRDHPRLVGARAGPRTAYRQPPDLSVSLPAGDGSVDLDTPFFVHSALWRSLGAAEASRLARLLQQQGVLVCGLADDVGGADAGLHLQGCTYTPERFRLRRSDLHQTRFLELQLGTSVVLDAFGRHRPEDVARAISEKRPVREVTAISARSWPADVAGAEALATKVQQLRQLCGPPTSIALALPVHDWHYALELASQSGADAVWLQFPLERSGGFPDADDVELILTARARLGELARSASREMALGVSGPIGDAAAAGVLLAVGATLVGADSLVAAALASENAEAVSPSLVAPRSRGAADRGSAEVGYLADDLSTLLAGCDLEAVSQLRPHHVALRTRRLDANHG